MPLPLQRRDLTAIQVAQQLRAMRSSLFEVVLLDLRPTRTGGMRILSHEQVLKSIPWLKAQNAHDININIRPQTFHLTLLDDLTRLQIDAMTTSGYQPCAIVETSPGNFQVWLDHGRELTDVEATLAAKMLATRFGADPGAAGKRHSGRLAGFTNRKPKHQLPNGLFPFVQLRYAETQTYAAASCFADDLAEAVVKQTPSSPPYIAQWTVSAAPKAIEEFHQDPRYLGDLSRADYAYCIYAHSHGVNESAMVEALLRRDLRHKGDQRAQKKYALHTVSRARRHVKS